MAAIARALSRALRTDVDVETLKTVVMFCGVGLFVSLLFASYGLNLSAGFFWQKTAGANRRAQSKAAERTRRLLFYSRTISVDDATMEAVVSADPFEHAIPIADAWNLAELRGVVVLAIAVVELAVAADKQAGLAPALFLVGVTEEVREVDSRDGR
jgi:hypothetical protein